MHNTGGTIRINDKGELERVEEPTREASQEHTPGEEARSGAGKGSGDGATAPAKPSRKASETAETEQQDEQEMNTAHEFGAGVLSLPQ